MTALKSQSSIEPQTISAAEDLQEKLNKSLEAVQTQLKDEGKDPLPSNVVNNITNTVDTNLNLSEFTSNIGSLAQGLPSIGSLFSSVQSQIGGIVDSITSQLNIGGLVDNLTDIIDTSGITETFSGLLDSDSNSQLINKTDAEYPSGVYYLDNYGVLTTKDISKTRQDATGVLPPQTLVKDERTRHYFVCIRDNKYLSPGLHTLFNYQKSRVKNDGIKISELMIPDGGEVFKKIEKIPIYRGKFK